MKDAHALKLEIEIRDSGNLSQKTFAKALDIENYAAGTPVAFYEVDHTENDNQLDIEKQSLYFEGHIFYYQYDVKD